MNLDDFVVRPGRKVRLGRWPTAPARGDGDPAGIERRLEESLRKLSDQQERFYGQREYALLVILQARDAAGKDSTIKHVMGGLNPQGVQVTSFKAPSSRELNHDYLWRSVISLPERGMIGIHNRSYYEELIVTRVHPEILERQHLPRLATRGDIWKRRYAHINQFERFLVENGTVVLKFFLHVSREQQRKRFLERITTPGKQWKFSLQDVKERALWKKYQETYEDLLRATSTELAPWHVIPADHKGFLHASVAEILLETVRALKLEWPAPDAARRRELQEGKRLLDAERIT